MLAFLLLSLFFFSAHVFAADNGDLEEGWQLAGGLEDGWESVLSSDDIKKRVIDRYPELMLHSCTRTDDGEEYVFTQSSVNSSSERSVYFFQYNRRSGKMICPRQFADLFR